MSTSRRRPILLRSVVSLALLLSVVAATSAPSSALAFAERPATQWVKYYAGKASATPLGPSRSAWKDASGAPANFIVNYTNFPQEAKAAFNAAVTIWAARYPSNVPITIDAAWAGNLGPGVLGSARPGDFFSGFSGAPDSTLWYPSALANALAGKDLDPANAEIVARFSSTNPWYLGTDGAPPAGRYDLETAVLHELGHGLGFLSSDSYDPSSGIGLLDQPTPFDAFIRTQDGRRLSDIPNPSRELGKLLTLPLTWAGSLGVAANNGVQPQLYVPSTYSDGSSISHLDEATYPSGSANTLMTPQLEPGEVIHDPGPITIGILNDLRTKPPTGPVTSLPSKPLNPVALVGERSALVTFAPPNDFRITQVTSYLITVDPGGRTLQADGSPIRVNGLTSGTTYSFLINAINSLGSGPAADTNSVTPQVAWKSTTIDSKADPNFVATTNFHKSLTAVYADALTGSLKRATLVGTKWRIETIDGPGAISGSTTHNLNGALSTCVTGTGAKQVLHIFYSDTEDKDLRHAAFDGKRWKYDIVDGNGGIVQAVADTNRIRTASAVSVSNACAATPDGLQVFYRDDTQGILLGAVLVGNTWRYELIDGDRLTDDRTTGDVAFHLAAVAVGRTVHVFYDSVLKIDRDRKPTTGDVREAVRNSISPTGWSYQSVDSSNVGYPVAGYGISLTVSGGRVMGAWLAASNSSLGTPIADTISWANLSTVNPSVHRIHGNAFGAPSQPLAFSSTTLAYGCQGRICALNLKTNRQSLVSDQDESATRSAAFATVAGRSGVLVGLRHRLAFLKP
jgi:hypothetical protein